MKKRNKNTPRSKPTGASATPTGKPDTAEGELNLDEDPRFIRKQDPGGGLIIVGGVRKR